MIIILLIINVDRIFLIHNVGQWEVNFCYCFDVVLFQMSVTVGKDKVVLVLK
jgi:hypothetical protein